MEGPRPPHESEFPHVVKFLDSQLRPNESWSITSEYPIAFSSTNLHNIRIITERDQVLSHAVFRPMIIKTPSAIFKVAGIGSVVTSTERRNEGLSSKTIQSCLEAAFAHGCDFAILWTNIYDFYRRFGFELAGTEVSVLLDQELPIHDPNLKILEGNKVSPEAIHRLYNQHTVTSVRSVEEVRKYLQIPNSRVYTAWGSDGQLRAYAVEGKGADLNGYVHEWGGGMSALMPLFAYIRKTQGRPITIIAPGHSQNLIRTFESHGVPVNRGFLGMIKILNPENLFAKIQRHARYLGVADFAIEKRENQFVITAKGQSFVTESEQDIVRLVFGPQKASEIHNFGVANAVIENLLPIHMWIWGWDSI